jgi:hypothetical protein
MNVYLYTCPLCRTFLKVSSIEPINQANKREFALRLAEQQMLHVQQEHPNVFTGMMDLSAQYTVALFQKHFLCTDPAAAALRKEIIDCAALTMTGDWEHIDHAPPPPLKPSKRQL